MSAIITVEDLSKEYRLGAQAGSYDTLREALTGAFRVPFFRRAREARNGGGRPGGGEETFWALKGVSFEVKPGEVLGIVGRNGAGKSTLLKILSRITEPTKGRVTLYGRVASLLEVGTGFHPELSGRENIFLNGAILGMRRAEIARKFDEIVAFAEIERFIDTPVKRYSSGMYMRLAFAVAAHLDPEILIVDEVLAVGDAEFQKKCFAKIKEIGQSQRTILFVSHNMYALRNICQRGIILERGGLVEDGEINPVVDKYVTRTLQATEGECAVETASFVVEDVRVYSANDSVIKTFDPVEIRVSFTAKTDIRDPGLYVSVLSLENQRLTGVDFKDFHTLPAIRAGSQAEMGFSIDSLPLLPGDYLLEVWLKDMAEHKFELVPQTFTFTVVESPVYGGRKIDHWYGFCGLRARTYPPAG